MLEVEVEFAFPYLLNGKVAAEFTIYCQVKVRPGRPARLTTWPSIPAKEAEVEEISGVEVEVGEYDLKIARWVPSRAAPDRMLEEKIRAWLEEPAQLDKMLEEANV